MTSQDLGVSLEKLQSKASDYMKLDQGLLQARSVNTNSRCIVTWHASLISILHMGLFLYKTTLSGGADITHGQAS